MSDPEIDALGFDKRFWAKVDKGDEGWHCWEWTGAKVPAGYGSIRSKGKNHAAHRASYRLHNMYPPEPEVVMHICDNRSCVNPLHLKAGTQRSNTKDRDRKGRQACGKRNKGGLPKKLNDKQREEIRRDKRSHRKIALEYGVSERLVWNIKNLTR